MSKNKKPSPKIKHKIVATEAPEIQQQINDFPSRNSELEEADYRHAPPEKELKKRERAATSKLKIDSDKADYRRAQERMDFNLELWKKWLPRAIWVYVLLVFVWLGSFFFPRYYVAQANQTLTNIIISVTSAGFTWIGRGIWDKEKS